MKRKACVLALAFSLIALCVGGTLAYYSAQGTAHNVINTSGSTITIQEWQLDEAGNLVPYPADPVIGVMPSLSISKIPKVGAAKQAAPSWIRMCVDSRILLESGEEGDPSLILADYDTSSWTQGADGWWYCNLPLTGGTETAALFNYVTFASEMPNEYQNATATVLVKAQAVQAANNGASALEASGWPADNGWEG